MRTAVSGFFRFLGFRMKAHMSAHMVRAFLVALTLLTLSACGPSTLPNSSSTSSTSSSDAPSSQASLVVTTPASATEVVLGQSLTLRGSGFTEGMGVKLGNIDLALTVVSSTELKITIPAALSVNSYTLTLKRFNDGATQSYSIKVVSSVLAISGVSPALPLVGSTVILTGTGFTGALNLSINNRALSHTINSVTELAVNLPTDIAAGSYSLSVTRADGQTRIVPLTLVAPLVVAPLSRSFNIGEVLRILGSGFDRATTVTWGGTALAVTFISSTELTVVVPSNASNGVVTVIVTRDQDRRTQNLSVTVAVTLPTLILSSVSPSTPTAPGASISLTGAGFVGDMVATVGGVSAEVSVTSATQMNVVIPLSVGLGVQSLVIQRTNDKASKSIALTILGPLSLGAQASIPSLGGTLTLAGTGFSADTSVTMDGLAMVVSAWTSTQISFLVPSNWRNSAPLVTLTRASDSSTKSQSYWINVPLTLEAMSAPVYRGQQVSIKGTGFVAQGNGNLFLAGVAQAYVMHSSEELLWTPAANQTLGSNVALRFERNDGQSTSINVIVAAIPRASVSPSTASIGATLTFTGSNLTSIRSVKFGPAIVPMTPSSDTSFSLQLPSNAASGDIVFVDSAGTQFVCCQLQLVNSVIKIAQVQAVQTHLIDINAIDKSVLPQERVQISPHRDLLIRAKIIKQNTNALVTPKVQIQITNSTGSSLWFDMAGPAVLSNTVPADTQSDLLDDSFTYLVPKNLISSDGSFSLLIKAQSLDGSHVAQYFTQPAVMPKSYMYLHLLPITISAGPTPATPTIDLTRIQTALESYFPLEIETRIEPTLDAGTYAGLGANPTLTLLDKVVAAHESSGLYNECHFYMGVIGFPLSNVAYLDGRQSLVSNLWETGVSFATGISTNYLAVTSPIPHELGHNFGRKHSWEDTANPNQTDSRLGAYANVNRGIKKYNDDNGIIPSTSLNSYENHWFFPTNLFDVMSYGSTNGEPGNGYKGMSYHTYKGFQRTAAGSRLRYSNKADCTSASAALVKPASNMGKTAGANPVTGNGSPGLLIQGALMTASRSAEISAPIPLVSTAQVRELENLLPYWQSRALQTSSNTSSNPAVALRVRRDNGSVRYFPITLKALDHDHSLHFSMVIPPQGTIKKIEVIDASQTVWAPPYKTVLGKLSQSQSAASALSPVNLLHPDPRVFTWAWKGNVLTVQFDNARYQALRVLYVSQSKTTLVADLGNRDGVVNIDFSTQAAQGTVKLELSDGLNSESRSFER